MFRIERYSTTVVALAVLLTSAACATPQRVTDAGEWIAYGRTGEGTRYSPLTRITRKNVAQLEPAWTFRTGEDVTSSFGKKSAFEATPLYVDETLFLSTPSGRVIALDPENGTERWIFDPEIDKSIRYSEVTSRGVAFWRDTRGNRDQCSTRIFIATLDARLIALDSRTGNPCNDFGSSGVVDLKVGIGPVRLGEYQVTSPPAVVSDLLIVGSAIGDNGAATLERGVVRAIDARTGVMRWSWDPIPSAPDGSAWKTRFASGAANAWAPISVDVGRQLVFIPTSSPSPDYYGGLRRGTNAHANSVVALRADSGALVWSFQVVRHDLWDYDVAAQPLLIELDLNGRLTPAVVVGTKMGHVFVLDRLTGEPLFETEERSVPETDVPGEETSPTQIFPTFPPPLVPQSLTAEQAWGLTEGDREECRKRISALRSEGIFTPPSIQGSVVVPGSSGGIHWGGMAFDPDRQILISNTNRIPFAVRLIPQGEFERQRTADGGNRIAGEFARQSGTPYGMHREPLLTAGMVPCSAPPWGALHAIDLRNRKVLWEVPLGFMPHLSAVDGHREFGSFNYGGAITTNGIVFIAATLDPHIRAFDLATGRELWRGSLPVPAQATPMTFEHRGRQYIVIAAGGHGKLGTPLGDHVVAFALSVRTNDTAR